MLAFRSLFLSVRLVEFSLGFIYDNFGTFITRTCWISGNFFSRKQQRRINIDFCFNMFRNVFFLRFFCSIRLILVRLFFSDSWWFNLTFWSWLSGSICWIKKVIVVGLAWWIWSLVEFIHQILAKKLWILISISIKINLISLKRLNVKIHLLSMKIYVKNKKKNNKLMNQSTKLIFFCSRISHLIHFFFFLFGCSFLAQFLQTKSLISSFCLITQSLWYHFLHFSHYTYSISGL